MTRQPDPWDTDGWSDRDVVITLEHHDDGETFVLVRIIDDDGRWLGVRYSLAGGLSVLQELAGRLAELARSPATGPSSTARDTPGGGGPEPQNAVGP